ncbi:carbonic anhydrase [Brooklawnia sp.]|uniref:carbonic anhydrase n=1 Tax=Brooklawnia sp. TaxID=2699740 RepID=UPI00311DF61E
MPFNDLLAANAAYAEAFGDRRLEGQARAGLCILACMDSRVDPLPMVGLQIGDAKVLRTPGAHLTPDALAGCVLAVNLLGVSRIMVVAHARCAMADLESSLHDRVAASSGVKEIDMVFGADTDRLGRLAADVEALRNHELIGPFAEVGGFDYDVDNRRLTQLY